MININANLPSYAVPIPFLGSIPTGRCFVSSNGHGDPRSTQFT